MTSFGASLRRERELRGVSLQEIAASTKISVRMLKAIEDDRFDLLPQGLFVRGFVREYARSLGLDEQKTLTDLAFQTAQTPIPEATWGEPKQETPGRFLGYLLNGGIAAGILGLVVVLIVSPGFARKGQVVSVIPPVDARAPAGEGQGTPVPSNEAVGGRGTLVSAISVLPQPLQLTLTATEDCWIGLDVGGDRVENRVLRKGESFTINAKQNASLAVGNAGGLLIAIDSGPPIPLGNRGEVRRNIPLSPEALGALSAGLERRLPEPIG